jgi:hypothetical protein
LGARGTVIGQTWDPDHAEPFMKQRFVDFCLVPKDMFPRRAKVCTR